MAISGYTMRCVTEGKSVLQLLVHIASSPPVVRAEATTCLDVCYFFNRRYTLRTDGKIVGY